MTLPVGTKIPLFAEGNAQASDVLQGKTFTNDSGTIQSGTIPNMGDKIITPSKSIQTLNKGFYNSVKVNPITPDIVKNNLSSNDISNIFKQQNPNLKPENIIQGIDIGGTVGTTNAVNTYNISNSYCILDHKKDDIKKDIYCILEYAFPFNTKLYDLTSFQHSIILYSSDWEGNEREVKIEQKDREGNVGICGIISSATQYSDRIVVKVEGKYKDPCSDPKIIVRCFCSFKLKEEKLCIKNIEKAFCRK